MENTHQRNFLHQFCSLLFEIGLLPRMTTSAATYPHGRGMGRARCAALVMVRSHISSRLDNCNARVFWPRRGIYVFKASQ
jgi:hypothetical protein